MSTTFSTPEDRLAKLGIRLPEPPTPFGAYAEAVQTGDLLFLSGMLATSGHKITVSAIGHGLTGYLRAGATRLAEPGVGAALI